MIKVVFVMPPYPFAQTIGSKQRKKLIGLLPPLGVGYLSSFLEKNGPYSCNFVDAIAEQLDEETTVKRIVELNPQIVGISSFTTFIPNSAYSLVKKLRQHLKNVPIIMGGPHTTSFGDSVLLDCPEIDFVIPGDAELTLFELLENLRQDKSPYNIKGIIYKNQNNEIIATPPAQIVNNLDILPFPARHIYNENLYEPLPSLSPKRPAMPMITARGCPWARCKFCYQGGKYASPFRRRSPENVVNEIKELISNYKVKNIIFWDDNFCIFPEWIEKFCSLIKSEKINIVWSVLSRVNTVTKEMLQQMADAGCYSIQFGIESGNPEILKLIRKGHTLEQCRNAVKWAKEVGMETRAFFVLGFPTETPEMSDETIKFACELNIDYVVFFSYYIAPGTPLAEIALREGQCYEFVGQVFPSYLPNTYPDFKTLANKVQSAYRRYYLRPRYFARTILRTVRRPHHALNQLKAFRYWLGLTLKKWV